MAELDLRHLVPERHPCGLVPDGCGIHAEERVGSLAFTIHAILLTMPRFCGDVGNVYRIELHEPEAFVKPT